jgi:hypothetical protein
VVGIDTVRIRIPVPLSTPSKGADVRVRRSDTPHERMSWSRRLQGGGTLQCHHDAAYIEASLPHVLYGHNISALSVLDARTALAQLIDETKVYVPSLQDSTEHILRTSTVQRLDLDRDFHNVHRFDRLARGLTALPHIRNKTVFTAAGINGHHSMEVRVTDWSAMLYDKHCESGGVASHGHVRFEARLRQRRLTGKWASDSGVIVHTMSDVTERVIERLAKQTWQSVSFGNAVMGLEQLEEVLLTMPSLSSQEARTMAAIYKSPRMFFTMSRGSQRKYRDLIAASGVALFDSGEDTSSVRLDWDTGREVVTDHATLTANVR